MDLTPLFFFILFNAWMCRSTNINLRCLSVKDIEEESLDEKLEQIQAELAPQVANDEQQIAVLCQHAGHDIIDLYESCYEGISSVLSYHHWNPNSNYTEEEKKFVNRSNDARETLNEMMLVLKENCLAHLTEDNQRKVGRAIDYYMPVKSRHDKRLLKKYSKLVKNLYDHSRINVTLSSGEVLLNLRQEPDLEKVIKEKKESSDLQSIWYAFRNEVAPKIREPFVKYKKLSNQWAQKAGFSSAAEGWVSDYEMSLSEYEKLIEKLVNDFLPFYSKLHAYVRHKLAAKYPYMKSWKLIPIQLTKNLWGQEWNRLLDNVMPYEEVNVDISPSMVEKFGEGNFKAVVETAQEYYESIGFDELPESFWNESIFEEGGSPSAMGEVDCHAASHNMKIPRTDVRLRMCGQMNADAFYTVHHELGHIHYYLAYRNNTILYYSGGNSGFHEAIGDTIALMSTGISHLTKLKLLETVDKEMKEKQRLNQLMVFALEKIPVIPFAYSIDKWLFDFYQNRISERDLNKHWWFLVNKYQGLTTPNNEERGEEFFDIGAKYHVAHFRFGYTRYQIARALQFQFLESICKKAGFTGTNLVDCDVEGLANSTEKFRQFLSFGGSKSWKEQFAFLTDGETDQIDASVALKYFSPLEKWLDAYFAENNIQVGW